MTPRVTLVLGSGGPVGHAFHAGSLAAIAEVTGWDPRSASLVIGTSAGAQVAALLRARMSASDLLARVCGETLSRDGAEIARHYVRPHHAPVDGRRWTHWRPGSSHYLAHILARPSDLHAGALVAALLPTGSVCLAPQADGFRALFGVEWPRAPLWIPAACLDTGERVVFGRRGAPSTDVGTAVICSGAVPGVCVPIQVDGQRMIDGATLSTTHADLLAAVDDDLAIVIAPLSMFAPLRLSLRWSLRRVPRTLVLVEPEAATRVAMGHDPMALSRGPAVARAAHQAMLRRLRSPSRADGAWLAVMRRAHASAAPSRRPT